MILLRTFSVFACGLALMAAAEARASAASLTTPVYQFTGGPDGANPNSSLTADAHQNAYGTTISGGSATCADIQGCGTIYRLSSSGVLTTLHTFSNTYDGSHPENPLELIRGKLYGGDLGNTIGYYGQVFSLNLDGSGFVVEHQFSGPDGAIATGLMQPASNGGIFGVSRQGGFHGKGTLFYFIPGGVFAVAHQFQGGSADGGTPTTIVEDPQGNIIGSTTSGGTCTTRRSGCGTIFEYQPKTRTYSILYNFQDGADGYSPGLGAVGPDGTVYGATFSGGANRKGTLFALTPGKGSYSFATLIALDSIMPHDGPSILPALSPNGSLTGAMIKGGFYKYQDGVYQVTQQTAVVPFAQFLVPRPHPNVVLGTDYYSGISPCTAIKSTAGCGEIFLYQPHGRPQ